MIDPLAWLYWVVVVVALFAAGANIAYCFSGQRRASKRPLRAMNAVVVLYFALIYLLLGRGVFVVTDISGLLIRPGIVMLLLLLAAEVIADWKR